MPFTGRRSSSLLSDTVAPDGDRSREERLAKNEALFRDINERIEQAAQRDVPSSEKYGFVCECANEDCFELIHITVGDYEHLRTDPLRFMVIEGHEVPEIEDVVERHPGYYIVAKTGPEQQIVRDADPRS